MPYALYCATAPAPQKLHFSSEQDALHAAALVLRGGQHVWLIEGPDVYYTADDVKERCRPILQLFDRHRRWSAVPPR